MRMMSRFATLFCLLLWFVALVVFQSNRPEPGLVAASLVDALRLDPLPSMAHPAWQALAAVPPRGPTIRLLALFSALSWLLLVALQGQLFRAWLPRVPATPARPSLYTAALGGALVLAAPSLSWVAWRPLPWLFDIVPALLALVLFTSYRAHGHASRAWAAAGCAGLALVESPLLVVWIALFWLVVGWSLPTKPPSRLGRVLQVTLAGLVPVVLALVMLYIWAERDPSAIWRGATTPWLRVRWIALELFSSMRQAWHESAWLYLLIFCWLPAGYSWALARRPRHHRGRMNIWFAVAALPGLFILLDLPFAPSHFTGRPPILSLLAALSALALSIRQGLLALGDAWSPRGAQRTARTLLAGLLSLAVYRSTLTRPKPTNVALDVAQEALAGLPAGSTLVTDGSLDHLLRLAARNHAAPLSLIDLSRLGDVAYRRSLAALRDDPAWRALTPVSPVAAIRDALHARTPARPPLILLTGQDWIVAAGRIAVPRPWGYEAAKTVTAEELIARVADFEAAKGRHADALARLAVASETGTRECAAWLALLARTANDLGVIAEHVEQPALAERLYHTALELAGPPSAAHLNLALLLERTGRKPEAEPFWQAARRAAPSTRTDRPPAALSSRGLLRDPEALRRWQEINTPKRGGMTQAVAQVTHASPTVPEDKRVLESRLQADLHKGDMAAVEKIVDQLLSRDPGNSWGNYALGVIHLKRNAPDLAEASFRRVTGGEVAPLALNNCAWMLAQHGRFAEALPYAQRAVAADPNGAALWDTLGVVCAGLGRTAAARQAFERVLLLNPDEPMARQRLEDLDAGRPISRAR